MGTVTLPNNTISGNGTVDVGGTANAGYVVIDIVATGWTGNIKPQDRATGTAISVAADVWYLTGSTYAKVAKGTALTGSGRILVPSGGTVVSLNIAGYSAGSIVVTTNNVEGTLPAWTA